MKNKAISKNVILIILATNLFCCCKKTTQIPSALTDVETTIPNNGLPNKTFLALGDSYTIGQNVAPADRWSVKLIEEIKGKFNITKHDIIARTGWTTGNLISAINSSGNSSKYDLVSLLIGVNNQYQGRSLAEYRTEFVELLKVSTAFVSNDSKKVIVLSIPDWGFTPFGGNGSNKNISTEIDAFNAVAKEECERAKITFIDITGLTRNKTGSAFWADDKLHYSGVMHQLWAKETLPFALEILK